MRILAVGCHPDDIEIACAGTLAKCVKRGDTVITCHASSGNLGHVVIPPEELKKSHLLFTVMGQKADDKPGEIWSANYATQRFRLKPVQ